MTQDIILTPDLVLQAYSIGVFPMADGREDDHIFWVDPQMRGILPLDSFHIPKRLAKTVRSNQFQVSINTDFRAVMEFCAEDTPRRSDTWINDEIIDLYVTLHERGYAHSVECRLTIDGTPTLVGGLYGVCMGSAFMGESMFTRERDASKVALVHLVGRLIAGGFQLLDTQFVTDHLAGFGAIEIPRDVYQMRLQAALDKSADFYSTPADVDGSSILQSITQTS